MSEAKDLIKALAAAEAELKNLDQDLDRMAGAVDLNLYNEFRAKKAAYREASEKVSDLRRMKRKMELGY